MARIFIRDSETIVGAFETLEIVTDRYEPSYPFDPNTRMNKPVVDVHDVPPDAGYAQILADISSGSEISLDLVNGYLYSVAQFLTIRITKAWTSYNIQIGRANTSVSSRCSPKNQANLFWPYLASESDPRMKRTTSDYGGVSYERVSPGSNRQIRRRGLLPDS